MKNLRLLYYNFNIYIFILPYMYLVFIASSECSGYSVDTYATEEEAQSECTHAMKWASSVFYIDKQHARYPKVIF